MILADEQLRSTDAPVDRFGTHGTGNGEWQTHEVLKPSSHARRRVVPPVVLSFFDRDLEAQTADGAAASSVVVAGTGGA